MMVLEVKVLSMEDTMARMPLPPAPMKGLFFTSVCLFIKGNLVPKKPVSFPEQSRVYSCTLSLEQKGEEKSDRYI